VAIHKHMVSNAVLFIVICLVSIEFEFLVSKEYLSNSALNFSHFVFFVFSSGEEKLFYNGKTKTSTSCPNHCLGMET
jgi:hypothetical protein